MAAAAVQSPLIPSSNNTPQVLQRTQERSVPKHDVTTTLRYHKDNEDGSPPHPTYAGRPETFERPFEPHQVTIKDIAGQEANYTLDGNGFQVLGHVATEKAFVDDDQIKSSYYPETEQLLKDVYVAGNLAPPRAHTKQKLTRPQNRGKQSLHLRPHHPSPARRGALRRRGPPRPRAARPHRPVLLGGPVAGALPPPRRGGAPAEGPRANHQRLAAHPQD
ncbi:hypothetical protein J3458_003675 [Metarhizium acridum]|uniref:uncharacterized protein n=1 Tax=Metarhizium acridum TaxID=92637 RepID=UPI001C6AC770|nr:hypothetical protein J3458_003675 [Metarhizium acridum]